MSTQVEREKRGHTPGPWMVHNDHVYVSPLPAMTSYKQTDEDGGQVVPFQPGLIALPYSYHRDGKWDGDDGDQEANANLIAAAPELLAALKLVYDNNTLRYADDCGPLGEGWRSPELEALWTAVETAIRKAEGKL